MDVITHYDRLIEENNDSFRDPQPLREYMDKWDGEEFIRSLNLSKSQTVQIGIGTGRLAVKAAPYCLKLSGIDISSRI